jgi:hypothetical protein
MVFRKKLNGGGGVLFWGFAAVFEGCFEKSVFLVVAKSW